MLRISSQNNVIKLKRLWMISLIPLMKPGMTSSRKQETPETRLSLNFKSWGERIDLALEKDKNKDDKDK